jgi:hypothetical protein
MKREDIYLITALAVLAALCGGSYWLGLFLPALAVITKENGYVEWLGFFGNLIGAGVTLLAAGTAWFAVQRQIEANRVSDASREAREKARDDAIQRDAIFAAKTILGHPMVMAGTASGWILSYENSAEKLAAKGMPWALIRVELGVKESAIKGTFA